MTDFLGRLRSLLFLPSTVAIMCRSDEMGPWWNAWLASATEPEGPGIQHVALTDRSRCPMISFIRQIRQGHPTFRVLDIGAVGNPWSIHSGVVDAIFDYQATNYPPCFSTAELHTRGRRCCSSKDDDCFDSLYTRERCCRGEEPVFVAMIDGDVTDALGEGWAKLMAFVDTVGKFDLVLTSHLLEDVTDPSVVVRLLPRVATAGLVMVPSKYDEFARVDMDLNSLSGLSRRYRGSLHHRWIFTVKDSELLAVPKLPYLEHDESFSGLEVHASNKSLVDMALLWRSKLPMRIINNGYLGPSIEFVIQMIRNALINDEIDRLRTAMQ
ncbi:unnamed protein product [Durusdinium trenchii]|uniref:Uncharacterized protein n=2 Tax=Durusdinium trenchii TaxID=1381693 RepID=A0ABP0R6B0_9DINO